jgi:hypothetical protein
LQAIPDALLRCRTLDGDGWQTTTSREFFDWRYGLRTLHYRGIALSERPDVGAAIFRVRRRGRALEAVLCEVFAPENDARVRSALCRQVARVCGADYVVALGHTGVTAGHVPSFNGPRLVVRRLASRCPRLALAFGDVELF